VLIAAGERLKPIRAHRRADAVAWSGRPERGAANVGFLATVPHGQQRRRHRRQRSAGYAGYVAQGRSPTRQDAASRAAAGRPGGPSTLGRLAHRGYRGWVRLGVQAHRDDRGSLARLPPGPPHSGRQASSAPPDSEGAVDEAPGSGYRNRNKGAPLAAKPVKPGSSHRVQPQPARVSSAGRAGRQGAKDIPGRVADATWWQPCCPIPDRAGRAGRTTTASSPRKGWGAVVDSPASGRTWPRAGADGAEAGLGPGRAWSGGEAGDMSRGCSRHGRRFAADDFAGRDAVFDAVGKTVGVRARGLGSDGQAANIAHSARATMERLARARSCSARPTGRNTEAGAAR